MTVLPWPDHLLTMREWEDLSEDNSRRYKLVEVIAPWTGRTDRVATFFAYSEAGIPDYWTLDMDALTRLRG